MTALFTPASFHDVDQFSAWERELGWDIDSTQLTGGANAIGFDHFLFPGMLAGHFHARQAMENRFDLPEDMVMFVIIRSRTPPVFCGFEVPTSRMAIVTSGRTQWAALPAGWDCYEFMVTKDLVRRAELLPPGYLEKTSRVRDALLPLVEPETTVLVRRLEAFLARARALPQPIDSAWLASVYEGLLGGLHGLIDAGLAARGALDLRRTRRPELVTQARELVKIHSDEHLTSEAVAQALGVSYRALNYAFRDALGLSPYRYLLTERLHASRRLLKTGDASVTDACVRYGFSTPSRFARQYRRLFGELPSETTRKLA